MSVPTETFGRLIPIALEEIALRSFAFCCPERFPEKLRIRNCENRIKDLIKNTYLSLTPVLTL